MEDGMSVVSLKKEVLFPGAIGARVIGGMVA